MVERLRDMQRRSPVKSFRGRALILLAGCWLALGLGVTAHLDSQGDSYFHLLIPAPVRAGLWIASAAIAFGGAFLVRDRWCFAALTIMPGLRFASAIWSWVMALLPESPPGDPNAWYRAIWYLALLGVIWLLTSVQDAPAPSGGKRAGDDP